ncbi:MAG: ATP-binding protein [Sideroxydans sp.]|nr:ATP-binding protein [Sideroxydans sp.]
MRLASLKYSEFAGTPAEWAISDLSLTNINLIVGKNAAGKTRTTRVLNGLAGLITGKTRPNFDSTYYEATFVDDENNSRITYELEIEHRKVKIERLTINDVEKLKLSSNSNKYSSGEMYFEKLDEKVQVQIPENSLAVASRRDNIQHGYLELLHGWAQTFQYYRFADNSENAISIGGGEVSGAATEQFQFGRDVVALVKYALTNFAVAFKKSIIEDMKEIGYEINDFGVTNIPSPVPINFGTPKQPEAIFLKEKGVAKPLMQNAISHGMYCAFVILAQFRFNFLSKKSPFILVDDVGEGLDYERSTKLISILIDIAEQGSFQLVMTTNDRFVMNKVPLKYWCVINREKGIVSTFNPRNVPDAFEDFEEYGGNNFDFFAKKFFLKKSKE